MNQDHRRDGRTPSHQQPQRGGKMFVVDQGGVAAPPHGRGFAPAPPDRLGAKVWGRSQKIRLSVRPSVALPGGWASNRQDAVPQFAVSFRGTDEPSPLLCAEKWGVILRRGPGPARVMPPIGDLPPVGHEMALGPRRGRVDPSECTGGPQPEAGGSSHATPQQKKGPEHQCPGPILRHTSHTVKRDVIRGVLTAWAFSCQVTHAGGFPQAIYPCVIRGV